MVVDLYLGSFPLWFRAWMASPFTRAFFSLRTCCVSFHQRYRCWKQHTHFGHYIESVCHNLEERGNVQQIRAYQMLVCLFCLTQGDHCQALASGLWQKPLVISQSHRSLEFFTISRSWRGISIYMFHKEAAKKQKTFEPSQLSTSFNRMSSKQKTPPGIPTGRLPWRAARHPPNPPPLRPA